MVQATVAEETTGAVTTTAAPDLDWTMTRFARNVPGVKHCIAVTADGLYLASTAGLPDAARAQLCAITSGIAGLTRGLTALLDQTSHKQVLIEMQRGMLIVASISDGSSLAVLTTHSADMGMVAYELQMLVTRIGQVLTPTLRAELTEVARR